MFVRTDGRTDRMTPTVDIRNCLAKTSTISVVFSLVHSVIRISVLRWAGNNRCLCVM